MRKSWFEVDKQGLSELIQRDGLAWIAYETISNSIDAKATNIHFDLQPSSAKEAILVISDNSPTGFVDLSHAYTLFAHSAKKQQPHTRGIFNLGEKLVLSMANEAEIVSTKGGIGFNPDGSRSRLRRKCADGTVFTARLRITPDDVKAIIVGAHLIIPPARVNLYINGGIVKHRAMLGSTSASLPTPTGTVQSPTVRNVRRTTGINIYAGMGDGWLYELGIPVVKTGDPYDIDVQQKVPLNMQRNNVPPAFLREVRSAVVSRMANDMRPEDAAGPMASDAIADKGILPGALKVVLAKRFGENAFVPDPNDPESTHNLIAKGHKPVYGGSLSGEQWQNVRDNQTLPLSSEIMPTAKPYDPNGEPEELVPPALWSPGQVRTARLAVDLGYHLMRVDVKVRYSHAKGATWSANYAPGGHLAFHTKYTAVHDHHANMESIIDLIIHEFGHEYEADHLAAKYHDALTRLAAKSTILALTRPEIFR